MNENQNELFRQEAINHQSNKLDGDVVIKPSMPSIITMALIMLASVFFFIVLLNYQVNNLIYLQGNIQYLGDGKNHKTIGVILINQDLVDHFHIGDVLKAEYKNFPKSQYGHYVMKITNINEYQHLSKDPLTHNDEVTYKLIVIPEESYISVNNEQLPVAEGMEFRTSVQLGKESLVAALFDVPADIGMARD